MMNGRDNLVRRSVLALVTFTLVMLLVGFLWLPSVHEDFTVQGMWTAICRAAGVPTRWSGSAAESLRGNSTQVVLERSMARAATGDAVGRGATLALNCTMCHGAQGTSASNAPNLAGQYPEVVIKQMADYRSGARASPIMQAIAQRLDEAGIRDLAAYYASLPKARTAPTTYGEALPVLVRVGAPLRNIAPCISCHGGVDQKLGAPWLEGMPRQYLISQLQAFANETRRNDAQAQMRNMVRSMTPKEISEVATFYARKTATSGAQLSAGTERHVGVR